MMIQTIIYRIYYAFKQWFKYVEEKIRNKFKMDNKPCEKKWDDKVLNQWPKRNQDETISSKKQSNNKTNRKKPQKMNYTGK
jgi:hypothetical protein